MRLKFKGLKLLLSTFVLTCGLSTPYMVSHASNTSVKKTYTVKSGDTLSGISTKYNVGLSKLLKYNNLTVNSILKIGQEVKLTDKGSSSVLETSPTSTKKKEKTSSKTGTNNKTIPTTNYTTYTVKSGNTLSYIANKYNTTVSTLEKINNLKSTLLHIGQVLKVPKVTTPSSKANKPVSNSTNKNTVSKVSNTIESKYNIETVIKTAKANMGIPYVWGGFSTNGFDCSGLIYYTFKKGGYNQGRLTAQGYYNISSKIKTPIRGDLVFFTKTYDNGPYITHVGIYLGDGDFIHAGTSTGVSISNIKYWGSKFVGYGRLQ